MKRGGKHEYYCTYRKSSQTGNYGAPYGKIHKGSREDLTQNSESGRGFQRYNAMYSVRLLPVYYFGMSAQIKAAIDRFYAFNDRLLEMKKKAVLLSACGDEEDWVTEALDKHFEVLCRYLNWEPVAALFAKGVYERADIEKSDYPEKAEKLGESI